MTTTTTAVRPIAVIAAEIAADWAPKGKGINYAAKPYLEAMYSLNSIHENYFCDSGKSVVLYFLCNARSWTGPVAKRVKAELKAMCK